MFPVVEETDGILVVAVTHKLVFTVYSEDRSTSCKVSQFYVNSGGRFWWNTNIFKASKIHLYENE